MGQRGHRRAGDYSFFYGKEMKIINWELDFLYITEDYQQLRELSLIAIGYHIYF